MKYRLLETYLFPNSKNKVYLTTENLCVLAAEEFALSSNIPLQDLKIVREMDIDNVYAKIDIYGVID